MSYFIKDYFNISVEAEILKVSIYKNNFNRLKVNILNVFSNEIDLNFFNKTNAIYFTGIGVFNEGLIYNFIIDIVYDDTYGYQYKIKSYNIKPKNSINGIINFLKSKKFENIGQATAKKIVDTLGTNTIEKILNDKDVLLKDPINLTPAKAKTVYDNLIIYKNESDFKEKISLIKLDLTELQINKIIETYKSESVKILYNNPYKLIDDIDGISFKKADYIAQQLGILPDSDFRIKAVILFILKNICEQEGNVYLTFDQLILNINTFLNLEIDLNKINELILILEQEKKIYIDKTNQYYYLYNNYLTEKLISDDIKRLNKKDKKIDLNKLNKLLDNLNDEKIKYSEEQKQAILNSLTSNLSIITGGPGTGKTTIIKGIILLYSLYYKLSTKGEQLQHISLMAPTGRAAKRMSEVLQLQAFTIHKSLQYYEKGFKINKKNKLNSNLIIVDEASMIDQFILQKLLESIKTGAKIIFVGDVNQLPSVGLGQILKDMINSNKINTSFLKFVHRQKNDSNILDLAYSVNNQDIDLFEINNYITNSSFDSDLLYRPMNTNEEIKIFLEKIYLYIKKQNINIYDDFQIITSQKENDYGTQFINELMSLIVNKDNTEFIKFDKKVFYLNDKVIQTKNMYEHNVMNGDIGYVVKIVNDKLYVYFQQVDEIVEYSKKNIDQLQLAYCITVHKSQGSEYKYLVFVLHNNQQYMIYKNLLYTAITRAKEKLIIVGNYNLLSRSNRILKDKQTTLKDFIIENN